MLKFFRRARSFTHRDFSVESRFFVRLWTSDVVSHRVVFTRGLLLVFFTFLFRFLIEYQLSSFSHYTLFLLGRHF
ncbi:hypothetical protein CW304_13240 [Bacillus sp. UFRGS-B20]|nr:hypothetical protein CW304_13240 [Bacillus sp. UFRGS-B20]